VPTGEARGRTAAPQAPRRGVEAPASNLIRMKPSEADALRLRSFLGQRPLWEVEEGTLVALPSVSLGADELISKMGDPRKFDERLSFLLLLLKAPGLRLTYVSSNPLPEDVVNHYLDRLPDPSDSRSRLTLISLGDSRHRPLAQKLLGNPSALEEVRSSIGDPAAACIVPMDVTPDELALAASLEIPIFGPAAEFGHLGTKSGSRTVARAAGVPVLPGRENLCHRDELKAAVAELQVEDPAIERVILKLDEGFSGEGNAVLDLTDDGREVILGGDSLDWPGFLEKMQQGGVIEAFIDAPTLRCPSVQIYVCPDGNVQVLASQEQILGGASGQAFIGCRFPADDDLRAELHVHAQAIAEHLSAEGVQGIFGLDFLVHGAPGATSVYLCEINLRMGGATAPCFLARLLTGGSYDATTGLMHAGGKEIHYLSREHVNAPQGAAFGDLRRRLVEAGLLFSSETVTGVWPHVCTTLGRGELGYIVFGGSREEIKDIDKQMAAFLASVLVS